MGIEAFLRGYVSRIQPQAEQDTDTSMVRLGRFGDVWTIGGVRKQHGLADEGSYFVANNGGTGVASAAAPTSFNDLAPIISIANTDTAGNQNSKRIHLDWIRLMETAAGTGATAMRFQVRTDNVDRSSAGTALTPVNVNTDVAQRSSVAQVRLFPTVGTLGGQARTLVGDVLAIPTQTTPLPATTTVILNFGGVEVAQQMWNTAASAAVVMAAVGALPPVVIGPGQMVTLNFLLVGQSAASSWTPEVAWWER